MSARRKPFGKEGFVGAMLLMLFVIFPTLAEAQEYPTKPVTLVIPMGAGGSHDLTARAVTSVAVDYLGQPIIVQLKPGGGGAIGTELVAKAQPDGYTLLMGGPGWNTTLPAIEARSKGPDELAAVCRINYSSAIIVTRPDQPYKSFKGMLEWAKANPGKLVFGHSGTWGHSDLAWKLLTKETGINTKSVPHDGGGPALMAILGGHIDVNSSNIAVVLPYIRAGKLIPLAVLDDRRDPNLPNVPTAKEEGIDLVCPLWRGIIAPKGTPRPIIEKLATGFKKMTEDKTVVTMIKQMGDEIHYLGPDEFTKVWREEFEAQKELRKMFKK